MSGTDLTSGERETLAEAVVRQFVDRTTFDRGGIGALDRSRCDRIVAPAVESILAARKAALIERLTSPEMVETLYAMLDEHGWADHYQCGWEDATPPPEGMCGKEWAERESLGIVLTALAAALRSEGEQ